MIETPPTIGRSKSCFQYITYNLFDNLIPFLPVGGGGGGGRRVEEDGPPGRRRRGGVQAAGEGGTPSPDILGVNEHTEEAYA